VIVGRPVGERLVVREQLVDNTHAREASDVGDRVGRVAAGSIA
jgi:hypothetical protein